MEENIEKIVALIDSYKDKYVGEDDLVKNSPSKEIHDFDKIKSEFLDAPTQIRSGDDPMYIIYRKAWILRHNMKFISPELHRDVLKLYDAVLTISKQKPC